jgi:hypothetical protein
MKAAVTSALIAAAVFTAGGAQAAPRFEGALVVFAKSGTCVKFNPVGSQMTVRFIPGGIGDNPPNTGFTFMWGNAGYNLEVIGAINSNFKSGVLTELADFASTGLAQIKFSTQNPETITPATPSVFVVGSITDFSGMTGCTVTFRMSAVRR